MKNITIKHVEHLAHKYAQEAMGWDEPIPAFETRTPGILESCLATPFMRFRGANPYKGFAGKAAMLFYLMLKNHPFKNGNKRIAVTTLLVFAYLNNYWISIGHDKLYDFAVTIAESKASLKDEMVGLIRIFIDKHKGPLIK